MGDKIIPEHIAVIMDGNRRWAKKRAMPIQLGHSAGADNLEKIANECSKIGIKYLTAYAFSTENWNREEKEVKYLMELLEKSIRDFEKRFKNKNIRMKMIGSMKELPLKLQEGIVQIEKNTEGNTGLTVNIAINYGGRAEIVNAIKEIIKDNENVDNINEECIRNHLYTKDTPDPNLIIRTGGEMRSSGFLTWQSIYSEYYFTETLWPDFDEKELEKAITEYNMRKRNYGK